MTDPHNFDLRNLEIIESQFEKNIDKLSNDPRIQRFKKEYEKLLLTLKESHTKERKSLSEYRNLSEDINENTGKIKVIMSISQQDSRETEKMRLELMEAKTLYSLQIKKEESSFKKIGALEVTLHK